MAYKYGGDKPERLALVPEPEKQPRRVPGRKRGPGKNNKHGSGCGTNNGYWAHKRADEDVCAPCIRAHRKYNKAAEKSAQQSKRAA